MAAAVFLTLLASLPAGAAERSSVVVDLSVLDALDADPTPVLRPPLPGRKPIPGGARPATTAAPSPADGAPSPAESAPSQEAGRIQAGPVALSTPAVYWQRPIPVTANAQVADQVGGRTAAAAAQARATADKLIGSDVDIEATADRISALPNGVGYRLLFSGAGAVLSDNGERLLVTVAERMDRNPELRLNVLAYAGGTPDTASRARLLSLERALAVRNFLFDQGVRGSRIDMRALGNTWTEGPAERVDLLLSE